MKAGLLGKFRPRRQWVIIFVLLSILSSSPNTGDFVDEIVCVSGPCGGVKLQNPVVLPYAWLLPEKKCNFCSLAGSSYGLFTSSYFPAIHLLNVVVGVGYLLVLSFFVDFGVGRVRENLGLKKRGKKKGKRLLNSAGN